jgi:hypothetical protein
VSLVPARTRELILDLALPVTPEQPAPTAETVTAAVEDGIRGALEAGWDPESRGRAFRYEIGKIG